MLLNINHEGESKTKNDCQKLKAKANVGLETHFQQKWANESLSSFETVDLNCWKKKGQRINGMKKKLNRCD